MLQNCCKHAFAPCIEEPSKTFVGENVSNLRPDLIANISVKSTPEVNYAVDLTIVSPFSGVQRGVLQQPSNEEVLLPDKKANEAAEKKNKKYVKVCSDHGFTFVPFVMYTTGKLHQDAVKFLGLLAEQAAAKRHIASSIIQNYYVKLLSVCLVKRIGYVISTKVNGLSTTTDLVEAFRFGNERCNEIGDSSLDF
jgi:hypothetical protein